MMAARLLPGLVLLAGLISLAVAAAPVAWHLMGQSAALPDRPPAVAAAPAPPPPVDLGPILALAPFGAPAEVAAPEAPPGETALDLELRGVVVQPVPEESTAFIAHDGDTQGYRPGDDVGGVATLVEVASTQVVLEVDGVSQTLSFPNSGIGLLAADEEPAPLTGPDRLRALVADQVRAAADAPPAPPPAPRRMPETTQDYIDLWRDRIRANPAEVLDTIGLIPTGEGYRVAEDHDSGVGLAGLREGDVVRSVNGQAVGDVERDRRLFDEVAASGLARIEVQRGDRTIVMSFPLE